MTTYAIMCACCANMVYDSEVLEQAEVALDKTDPDQYLLEFDDEGMCIRRLWPDPEPD